MAPFCLGEAESGEPSPATCGAAGVGSTDMPAHVPVHRFLEYLLCVLHVQGAEDAAINKAWIPFPILTSGRKRGYGSWEGH